MIQNIETTTIYLFYLITDLESFVNVILFGSGFGKTKQCLIFKYV